MLSIFSKTSPIRDIENFCVYNKGTEVLPFFFRISICENFNGKFPKFKNLFLVNSQIENSENVIKVKTSVPLYTQKISMPLTGLVFEKINCICLIKSHTKGSSTLEYSPGLYN
jgi:hypothetical protein